LAAETNSHYHLSIKIRNRFKWSSWTKGIGHPDLLLPADLIHLKEGKSRAKATRSTHAEQILTNQSYADVLCLSLEQRRVLPFHANAYPNAIYTVYQKTAAIIHLVTTSHISHIVPPRPVSVCRSLHWKEHLHLQYSPARTFLPRVQPTLSA
jgi:hypothetical protein